MPPLRRQSLPEFKVCYFCGEEFERRITSVSGRRYLRQPEHWKRQRFCSIDCVRSYRLRGRFRLPLSGMQTDEREILPPYLERLEPVRPQR